MHFVESFSKVLNTCCQNGFFSASITDGILTSLQDKPLGTLLRRNIKREWLLSLVNNTDTHVFPLEVTIKSRLKMSPVQSPRSSSLLLPDVIKNYSEILPSLEFCGFGAYGYLSEKWQHKEFSASSLLQNFEGRLCLCVVHFCSSKTATDWFNYWSKYRYRWWRKYSSQASKFSMSEVTNPAVGEQQLELMMDCPWGREIIETITMVDSESFNAMYSSLHCNTRLKSGCSPALILCESELDRTTLAYLINCFAEKWSDGSSRQVFQLNVKFAPYQVAFILNSHASELKKMKEVAIHLSNELKKSRVIVYPLEYSAPEFKKFDAMGVPYTIVLDDKALQSGIAGLRNRDSTLQEQVHFIDLTPKLLKYLQKYHETSLS